MVTSEVYSGSGSGSIPSSVIDPIKMGVSFSRVIPDPSLGIKIGICPVGFPDGSIGMGVSPDPSGIGIGISPEGKADGAMGSSSDPSGIMIGASPDGKDGGNGIGVSPEPSGIEIGISPEG